MLPILAVISGGSIINLLIQLVVAGLIMWLIWWFLDYVGLPDPFNKVARVIVGLFVLIFLINVLLSINGNGFIAW